jgi:hypothetical protein
MFDLSSLATLAKASIELDAGILAARKRIAQSALDAEQSLAEASMAFTKSMTAQFRSETGALKTQLTDLMDSRTLLKTAGLDTKELDDAISEISKRLKEKYTKALNDNK